MPEVLAVIPARGGSKGLPRKNVQPVGGVPLVARAVRAALGASHVSRVVVSTDDPEIAAAARAAGSDIIHRPQDISGDTASSESALLHALDHLKQSEAYEPDIVLLIQCTSPFVTAADIDGTVACLHDNKVDSSFAAVPFHHFVWGHDENGTLRGVNHDGAFRKRRQDTKPQYLEAGSVYAMRVAAFRAAGNRFCGNTRIFVGDAARGLEIDSAQDLRLAQNLAPYIDKTEFTQRLPKRLDCIVFDFDGVFTDNAVILSEDGRESVRCNRSDGLGIDFLRKTGLRLLVLSKEKNPVVTKRCAKLRIECIQGIDDKKEFLQSWLDKNGLSADRMIYVGNDQNDLDCLALAACAVGPADSHPSILSSLDIVLHSAGGKGAVRELCDLVLEAQSSGAIQMAQYLDHGAWEKSGNDYVAGAMEKRPWGTWQVLAVHPDWCLKRIEVNPGQSLSLQRHRHRQEVWVVANGIADVTVDDYTGSLGAGEAITIPKHAKHRLTNSQGTSLVVFELQTGEELREDDIERFADIYNRV